MVSFYSLYFFLVSPHFIYKLSCYLYVCMSLISVCYFNVVMNYASFAYLQGLCDRKTGLCQCFPGYDGVACQRSTCPHNCMDRGLCLLQKTLANKAGMVYNTPWDAMKHVGCQVQYILQT